MTRRNDPLTLSRLMERKIGRILRPIRAAGLPVWVVGGVLRDFLLDRPFRDIDLLVKGAPERLTSVLPDGIWVGKVIPALVLSQKRKAPRSTVQITVFSGPMEEELARRDFSINALALSLGEDPGEARAILDYFGGAEDLDRGLLRCPCPERDPFSDDPVRVLRLVRFSATLGFSVDPDTLTLARKSVRDLSTISGERRRQELFSLFSGSFLPKLSRIFPEEFLWEVLSRASGTSDGHPCGPGTLARVLQESSRWSRRDPLFRMWFLWEQLETEGLLTRLPFSRAEGRRLKRFGRLVHFFRNVGDDEPRRPSDRTLLLDSDHRETIRRMVGQGLPPQVRSTYSRASRKIIAGLCRPWEEVRNDFWSKD